MAESETSTIAYVKSDLQQSNMESKILTILAEAYPNLDCGPGTPLYEMLVRPMAMLWTRQADGVSELLESIDPTNYNDMPEVDLDILLNRYFVTRRTGNYVTGTVRLCLIESVDININAGDIYYLSSDQNIIYRVINNKFVSSTEIPINTVTNEPYIDVAIQSVGKGREYNASTNDAVTVTGAYKPYVKKAYFIANTSDGGTTESNYAFFSRAKEELASRNLYSYKSVRSLLYDTFDVIKEVVPIGIRDNEMLRDLITIPKVTESGTVSTISGYDMAHRGGMCDIYVRPYMFTTSAGYSAPLGFPLTYNGHSLVDDANNTSSTTKTLLSAWNEANIKPQDVFKRMSSKEKLPDISPSTDMTSLTYNLSDIDAFLASSSNTLLHTDNLAKLMWPIVFTATIRISGATSSSPAEVKSIVVNYINSLKGSDYPQVGELISTIMANSTITVRTDDLDIKAYYLTEMCQMECIMLNKKTEPAVGALLIPEEDDSLKFSISPLIKSQISLRTCCWYTNTDLITIEVVS